MRPKTPFKNRVDAGQQLARALEQYRQEGPIVLGLPRGGVPVAFEVARALNAPLDVCVVRKLGAPVQPELGIGAVSEGGVIFVDESTRQLAGVSEPELQALIQKKRAEVEARVQRFRRDAPSLELRNHTVIVVDDGIATGGTAKASLEAIRRRGATKIILAVPVASAESLRELAPFADAVVCLHAKDPFYAVGLWYDDFSATTDEEVVVLLDEARRTGAPPPATPVTPA
jgi:putative phosphoribosyl transferase